MKETLIRRLKGAYMAMAFSLWFIAMPIAFVLSGVFFLFNRLFVNTKPVARAIFRGYIHFWLFILRLGGLYKVERSEGKPYDGASVVVANHPGLFDVLVLISRIDGLSVMVAHKLSKKLPLISPYILASGYIFSPNPKRESPVATIFKAEAALQNGDKFQLFPEGTRSMKGGLLPFKAGAFKIAAKAGVMVQPVLIQNDPPFLPHEDKWHFPPLKMSRIRLIYWEPLPPPKLGEEAAYAKALERRYREALGLSVERKPEISEDESDA